jgi:hypothetical protein
MGDIKMRLYVRLSLQSILMLMLLSASSAMYAASDPRFFGTYCGEHVEEYDIPVCIPFIPFACWRETRSVRVSIEGQLKHSINPAGQGFIQGRATASGGGKTMSAYLSGLVTGHGRAKGLGVIPGIRDGEGRVTLSENGEVLTAEAYDYRIRLSKADCGNSPPTASITTEREIFPWGRLESLRATANDPEDESIPRARLVWKSNRDTSWRQYGLSARTNDLSPGEHIISFTAIDSGGRRAVATKTIQIENNVPRVEILTPGVGQVFYAGQRIPFSAQVTDVENGNLTNTEGVLTWSYGSGRVMGAGTPISYVLPVGEHLVTASANDGAGAGTATRTVIVRAASGNVPPTVTIRQPVRYQVTGNGAEDCIALEVATAFDHEDRELYGDSIVWTDLMEGTAEPREITTRGRRVIECGLMAGDNDTKHTITVTVTDSAGATSSASQEIYVTPIAGGVY